MRVAPGRSAQCVRELCTMFGVASKHKCVAYVGGLFGMLTCFFFFFGPFPQGVDDFPGCGGQGAGPGPPCMVGVLLCMSVSVCPYLRYSLQWPCEGGWLVLVPPKLDPSFYTLAKAKRRSSRYNRKTLVITVGPPQSQRVIT